MPGQDQSSRAANGLETPEDVDALILGLTLLGTGGGGLPERGKALLIDHVGAGKSVHWVSPDELPDEARVCSVFGMGSIAPRPTLSDAERHKLGFGDRRFDRPGVRAVQELASYAGAALSGLVSFEIGAYACSLTIDTAMRLGLKVVDGDYSGRAVPEMSQALPAAFGQPLWPLTICDDWGNALIMKDCPSPAVAERVGKMVSIVTKIPELTATCAHAAYLLDAGAMRGTVIPGSLTRSLRVGRSIVDARRSGQDVPDALAQALDGWILFRGAVTRREWESTEGYMVGATEIAGHGRHFAGATARVWFKNENHILWVDDAPRALSPDLIMIVDEATGEPKTNTVLAEGDRVAVLGCRCDARYRQGTPLALMEPRHYGFDIPYRPIEEMVRV